MKLREAMTNKISLNLKKSGSDLDKFEIEREREDNS